MSVFTKTNSCVWVFHMRTSEHDNAAPYLVQMHFAGPLIGHWCLLLMDIRKASRERPPPVHHSARHQTPRRCGNINMLTVAWTSKSCSAFMYLRFITYITGLIYPQTSPLSRNTLSHRWFLRFPRIFGAGISGIIYMLAQLGGGMGFITKTRWCFPLS